jgi:hypothetical protein
MKAVGGEVEESLSDSRNLQGLTQNMRGPAPLENCYESLVSQENYLFSVAPSHGTIGEELRTRLGDRAAEQLVETWRNTSLLGLSLETETEITVFTRSNRMARNQYYDGPGERATQEDYLKSAGCAFAREAAAILLCARLVEKAYGHGVDLSGEPAAWFHSQGDALHTLSNEERDLLTRLKFGVMRTQAGALGIDASGQLRAFSFFPDDACPNAWALAEKMA